MAVAAGEGSAASGESKSSGIMATGKEKTSQSLQALAPVVADSTGLKAPGDLKIPLKDREGTEWNTKNLGRRIGVDFLCAGAAASTVAPIITAIDRAIIENASGKRDMGSSLRATLAKIVSRPHHFLTSRPFLLIFAVYSGTYVTANALDTTKATMQNKPAHTTTSGPSKFVATSVANLSLGLMKDSQFTKLFGTVSPRPIPPITYALYSVRDCLTIFASFNLPQIIAPKLPLTESMEKYFSRASAAQFLTPAAIQLVSTPFHLLGLDMYNRNGGTPLADRLAKVRLDWLKSSLARMCRIVPAFGVGGVVNNSMRSKMMGQLE